jgi:hypothetical protein
MKKGERIISKENIKKLETFKKKSGYEFNFKSSVHKNNDHSGKPCTNQSNKDRKPD